MIDIEKVKSQIVQALMPLKPEKIILFGSYAYGTPTEDSDIDLYIVTPDNFIPKSFEENFEIKKQYFNALNDFTDIFATDMIIHTKEMNKKFLELNSAFARKIYTQGKVLYAQL